MTGQKAISATITRKIYTRNVKLTLYGMLNKGGEIIKSDYIDREFVEHCLYALMPANRLVCLLCLETGLRVDDVLSLRTEQLYAPRVTVIEKKTKKRRSFTIKKALLAELQAQAGKVYVFEHRDDVNRHRTRQAVFMDLKRAARAFRIKVNFSPHSLRKVYAVELMRKYGDIERVRKALNHDNDIVTAIYAMADIYTASRRRK